MNTAVYFANNSTFDDITLRMGNIEKERHNNPPRMIKEQVHSRKAHYNHRYNNTGIGNFRDVTNFYGLH